MIDATFDGPPPLLYVRQILTMGLGAMFVAIAIQVIIDIRRRNNRRCQNTRLFLNEFPMRCELTEGHEGSHVSGGIKFS